MADAEAGPATEAAEGEEAVEARQTRGPRGSRRRRNANGMRVRIALPARVSVLRAWADE